MFKHTIKRLKIARNVHKSFFYNKYTTWHPQTTINTLTKHNLTSRNLHKSRILLDKIYVDSENNFAYQLLPPLAALEVNCPAPTQINSLEQFEATLKQNWRKKTASEIVQTFENLNKFCVKHKINFSDVRFDGLVDGLMDHCEKLTDPELSRILQVISQYPPCESVSSHNFEDMWSCLDDVCCWKFRQWDLQQRFRIAGLWYQLHMGRLSDYVFEFLNQMPAKAKKLSKNELLYTFFYVNVCRRKSIEYELEYATAERVKEFNLNELGIIAMAYFKSKSKVKPSEILFAMIAEVTKNYEIVNEITLGAILKTLRLSRNVTVIPELSFMLDKLSTQIPRLGHFCCLQICLIGTGIQFLHTDSLRKSSIKILNNLAEVRLKDIERVLLACAMFNFEPTEDFYQKCYEELHKSSRRKEFVQYKHCLPTALHFLSYRNFYSNDLMNDILQEDYINEAYGKPAKLLPREIFSLDCCIDIDCPDYKGARLTPAQRYKGAKWLTEFSPEDQFKRLNASDKFSLHLQNNLAKIVGAQNLVKFDHVLPHFARPDLILCREKSSGKFVEIFGFERYILGDVKRPFEIEKFDWFVVIGLMPTGVVKGTGEPMGLVVMKQRQLRKIGYKPVIVASSQLSKLSEEETIIFLKQKLDCT